MTGTSHGVSDAARYVYQTLRNASRRQREAVTFSRQPAFDALRDAWEPCKMAGWDGPGSVAIEQETYQTAWLLIESLPDGCALPTVQAEPDGHLSLEWYRHPRRLLSVSVGPDGLLYWAALVGTEDPRGSCQFSGDFPKTLLYWIGRVFAG